jgi:hypothetical protein
MKRKVGQKLPPPPIDVTDSRSANGVSIWAILLNQKNGWNRFPKNAGSAKSFREMEWTNDDGTIWPKDYQ